MEIKIGMKEDWVYSSSVLNLILIINYNQKETNQDLFNKMTINFEEKNIFILLKVLNRTQLTFSIALSDVRD